MGWLYENRRVQSEKNGRIHCLRLFGRWQVFVNGFDQSGTRYLSNMWRRALKRLPAGFQAGRILIFGLGIGDTLDLLHDRFPSCRITAVEWDPVMIDLMTEFRPKPDPNRPEIVNMDMNEALSIVSGNFDLIILDAFTGQAVGSPATRDDFFRRLRGRLSPSGHFLANVFAQPELLGLIDRFFARMSSWRFRYNTLALYASRRFF